ncbi:MAG: S-methyl-5'-thioinosine phosphorylase [Candidatus Nitricoxidivorans perseverans]|uniref:Probable 6-oxopurine nucleoside phosphorylase n=1 Tax=Candidatus Nitricoxidivorans perseverans TaxID=2975601 RepID=A0AA49FM82_9PROT|nr:MAG: S-methyl-5'-thioinosine phosphorylase [Candidatus Nitricoxidivorans perseverans]
MLAIIGGSGLTQLSSLSVSHQEVVRTPYGEPSGALTFGRIGCRDVVFLARHGYGHTIPPHLVNYRANIWALTHAAKADRIVSVASVGGIRADLEPGAVVVPHQIVDYTWGRHMTFFEGGDSQVVHVDFTEPYDGALRRQLLEAAGRAGEAVLDGAVYAATQGPRLETAAEIDRLARDGADVVGMTGMPEASLAREAEVPYAAVCLVANWAAGRASNAHAIRFDDIEAVLQQSLGRVRNIIERFCEGD